MKLISWNVNGLRAIDKKGFVDIVAAEKPDILCLQETKIGREQLDEINYSLPGYSSVFSGAEKKGYSGVATFVRDGVSISRGKTKLGIDIEDYDSEGRFAITHHPEFVLHNIYFPSGTTGDERQAFKYRFLDAVFDYLNSLPKAQREKAIICGDYNICHTDIDIHHPKEARKRELSGFLPDECAWMDSLVEAGFVDSYRHCNPKKTGLYSWWTYRAGARDKNLGWRIDYFFVHKKLASKIKKADILTNIYGSDHAPIVLELKG